MAVHANALYARSLDGGVPAFVGFVFSARRIAAGYLSRRALARPRVPWRQINAIKAQALLS